MPASWASSHRSVDGPFHPWPHGQLPTTSSLTARGQAIELAFRGRWIGFERAIERAISATVTRFGPTGHVAIGSESP